MAWSKQQQIILAVVPKVSSLLSLFGSAWILTEVLTDNAPLTPKRKHPYHRLLLGMSVYDILESVWNFASTWALPRDTQDVWQPKGTTATCTTQGFFLTLSVAVPIYNAFLSLYYVMVIVYGIPDKKIAERAEPLMHLVAFGWASFTALYSASTGLINNANLWCWIAPLPGDCKDTRRHGKEEANCTRGDNAWIYRWAFYFAPLWFCIFFATICTLRVYYKVKKYDIITLKYRRPDNSFKSNNENGEGSSLQVSTAKGHRRVGSIDTCPEEDMDTDCVSTTNNAPQPGEVRVENSSNLENNNQQSAEAETIEETTKRIDLRMAIKRWKEKRQIFREDNPRTAEVFEQSLWYLGVFYITHAWSTTNRTIQLVNDGETYFAIIAIHSFFDPLQGFLNYLVYQRPRYKRIRAAHPQMGPCQALWKALTLSRYGGAEFSCRAFPNTWVPRSAKYLDNSSTKKSLKSLGRDSDKIAETWLDYEPVIAGGRALQSNEAESISSSCHVVFRSFQVPLPVINEEASSELTQQIRSNSPLDRTLVSVDLAHGEVISHDTQSAEFTGSTGSDEGGTL